MASHGWSMETKVSLEVSASCAFCWQTSVKAASILVRKSRTNARRLTLLLLAAFALNHGKQSTVIPTTKKHSISQTIGEKV